MNYTDISTFILSLYFLIRGAARGFLSSLMIPFSIIIATIISIIYYQITNNIIVSLLIGLIGPLLFNLLFKFILKTWAKATNTEVAPSTLSRVAGAAVTVSWGWVFIVFTLILLAVLPPWGETLTAVHQDVVSSSSYSLAKPLGEFLFNNQKQKMTIPSKSTANSPTKSLADDPRFQQVLQDPEIQNDIDTHNIVKLMGNPKMISLTEEIMSDPETMKKVLAVYSSQTQAPPSTLDQVKSGLSTIKKEFEPETDGSWPNPPKTH